MGAVNKVLTATPDARASLVKGSPTFWNAASYVYQRWKADQERKKTEGIPAAPAVDTGGADTGLNVDTSATKRKRGLKGRRGLMIGSGSSSGGTTGTGLNI